MGCDSIESGLDAGISFLALSCGECSNLILEVFEFKCGHQHVLKRLLEKEEKNKIIQRLESPFCIISRVHALRQGLLTCPHYISDAKRKNWLPPHAKIFCQQLND